MMNYGSTLLPERFWAKTRIGPDGFHSQTGENLGPCWLWTAGAVGGYGRFHHGSRLVLAHRLTLAVFGDDPGELKVDHLCRVPACCNPDHLEAVTQLVNMSRGARRAKTHCPQGHVLSGDNLYLSGRNRDGYSERQCRTCMRAQRRAYYQRTKAKRRARSM